MTTEEIQEKIMTIQEDNATDTQYQNLKGQDLTAKDFSGQDLMGTNFVGATLLDCDFKNTILCFANFTDAITTGADFTGANIYGVPRVEDFLSEEQIKTVINEPLDWMIEARELQEQLSDEA